MKTVSIFLALFCGIILYPQTVPAKSPKKLFYQKIQTANHLGQLDSLRQVATLKSRKDSTNPEQRIQTQIIPLTQGWAGISSYLNPDDPAVAQIMAAIEQQLIILQDFNGNIYQPSIENTLTNWDFRQGYFIKMASAGALEIVGMEPLSRQIDLQTGWNLIPVLSEVAVDVEDYFFDNNAKIEIVTEVAGVKVFWPDKEVATLTQLTPGKAYLVKVNEPFSLFELPSVTTTAISEITTTSAMSGGIVNEAGSSPVIARGLVWSAYGNATVEVNDGITFDGSGTGEFVSTLTGLTPGTFYYARAYATNHVGTAYGNELLFVTLQDSFTCGQLLTDSRDGQQYPTVHIGSQCWMAANLNIGQMINANVSQSDNGIIEKHCYNNSLANCNEYGGLYQWDEIMEYTTVEGVQGICPEGWFFPTDAQWTILENFVGGYLVAGGKLKEAGTAHWLSPNVGATNSSGFTALGGGFIGYDGTFFNLKSTGVFWTSTAPPGEYPWPRILNHNLEVVYRVNYYPTTTKFSVRCMRDAPAQVNIPTVITTPVSDVTGNLATSGGNVTDDGGVEVSMRGVVWNTSENPTIQDNLGITSDGTGTGEFISELTNLLPETTYFVRAYATNCAGTAYGDQMSFTTQALPFVCGNTFTDSRDGKQYATVHIGDQCWMAENLAYLPAVSPPSEGSYVDPLYYVYGYNGHSTVEAAATQNYQTYGALYNWAAASTACPTSGGWYLPTDDDWKILEANADSQYGIGNPVWDIADWRGFDVGKNLKTTDGWNINTGTDLEGFSAMPAGYRFIAGNFTGISESGGWWSSSDNSTTTAWYRYVNAYYDQAYRYWDDKSFGLSVRCIIDESQTSVPTVITSEVVSITSNSALCGGNVTGEGGSDVSARGMVWNTLENPTIEINEGISYDGTGIGEYVSYLANLTPETQYFVRAYAANSNGTAYGVQRSFYTAAYNDLCEALDNCSLSFGTGGNAPWFSQNIYTFDGVDAAQTGEIGDNGESWFQTNIVGPGVITFNWKVSSESDYDFLRFYFDGSLVEEMSGEVDWNYIEFEVPEGLYALTWLYSKDGSVLGGLDAGWVDQLTFTSAFELSLCQAVDNCNLNFSTSGDAEFFPQTITSSDGTDAAQSGPIQDNQEVWMETTIEGPGIVSFWWKVISEEDFDYMRFHIDDFHQDAISGDIDWQYQEYTISEGIHTIRWIYTKDGSVSYLDDCGWVDQVQFTPVESICEAVDNCILYFATGGDAPFFSQANTTFDGEDAAQSGGIENNGQSWLETIVEGPGTLTFYWKVSSQENYDYLNFYIDGVLVDEMSGEVDWHYKEFGIPAGYYALTWKYVRQGEIPGGQDAGWVDQVQYSTTKLHPPK